MEPGGCLNETLLVAFVGGEVPREQAGAIDSHLASCESCRRVVGALAVASKSATFRAVHRPLLPAAAGGDAVSEPTFRPATPRIPESFAALQGRPAEIEPRKRGDALGRFLIVDVAGAGGMGVVYSAYDPELDRRVALKVLRPSGSEGVSAGRERILVEARALAKLSHPNVIAVYDVGTVGQEVFIAMEFVAGKTLRAWQREARDWKRIVAMYREAGWGLDAAHRAGLVHRDFKPENVLVGEDGRARVLDFGLARAAVQAPGEAGALVEIAGTPGYMAPEQRVGAAADARTDQYAFCVALAEALTGERPRDDGELAEKPGLPGWLRRAVARGLRSKPGERYPSMNELLLAVSVDPGARRRRIAAAALGLGAIVALAVTAGRLYTPRSQLCAGGEAKLAGVWDPAVREQVHGVFRASGKPWAESLFASVAGRLDGWSGAWASMHREACEATRLRAEQSEEMLDLRMACLQGKLSDVRAFTAAIVRGGEGVTESAVEAGPSPAGPLECADLAALSQRVKPPRDPKARAEIERLRGRISDVVALRSFSKSREAMELALPLARDARALGYAPLTADVLSELGYLQRNLSLSKEAEATFYDAVFAAQAGRHVRSEIETWLFLAELSGAVLVRREEGERFLRHAGALVESIESPDDMRSAWLTVSGSFHQVHGESRRAIDELREALRLKTRLFGVDSAPVAGIWMMLGRSHLDRFQFDEAAEAYQRAIAIRRKGYAPRHPTVSDALAELAEVSLKAGKLDAALAQDEEAASIVREAYGPEHESLAYILDTEGGILRKQGKLEQAVTTLGRSVEISKKSWSADDPSVTQPLTHLGEALLEQGKPDEAGKAFAEALAVADRTVGDKELLVAPILNGLAKVELRRGHRPRAIAHLDRAVKVVEAVEADASVKAFPRLELARTLWEAGHRRDEAVKLAGAAREAWHALAAPEEREADAWLAAHRP